MELPTKYSKLKPAERRKVREEYIKRQDGKCLFCKSLLSQDVPFKIKERKLNMKLFPEGFLDHPVHLHHDHDTDLTLGSVHAYCNGILWQYYGE